MPHSLLTSATRTRTHARNLALSFSRPNMIPRAFQKSSPFLLLQNRHAPPLSSRVSHPARGPHCSHAAPAAHLAHWLTNLACIHMFALLLPGSALLALKVRVLYRLPVLSRSSSSPVWNNAGSQTLISWKGAQGKACIAVQTTHSHTPYY